jgi:DNA-binding NarL/FixJ family response regulator
MAGQAIAVSEEVSPSEPAAHPWRIVLVDDHAILRDGLRSLLEIELDLEVVAEAANYADAMECVSRLGPALIITDIVLPGPSGLDLVHSVRERNPDARFIMLTAHDSEVYIRAALDARANGYVLKDASRSELLLAIRTVMAGHRYLCRRVTARIVSGYLHGGSDDPRGPSVMRDITAREREVLTLIALGQANKTIARQLGLSVKTVEKHRSNLMRKLDLHNAAGITRFALNHQLIALADAAGRQAGDFMSLAAVR